MEGLTIKQDKHILHLITLAWLILPIFAFRLSHDAALFYCIGMSTLFATLHWNAYQDYKKEVKLNKKTRTVNVMKVSFFGKVTVNTYHLDEFKGIRSYLRRSGKSNTNIVDLVFVDSDRGLMLSSFAPSSGKKFFTLKASHLENEKATELRRTVSNFTGLADIGFLGQKWLGYPNID